MATLGIPKLQKLDDNKTVNQTLHNSKCTHVTQNRNWTSTTKMQLPDYLHALLLSHTHTLYPRTCHMGGTGDQRDIHTYMPEHHPVSRAFQGSAAWAKPLRINIRLVLIPNVCLIIPEKCQNSDGTLRYGRVVPHPAPNISKKQKSPKMLPY